MINGRHVLFVIQALPGVFQRFSRLCPNQFSDLLHKIVVSVYPNLRLCPLRPSSCPSSIRHQTSVTEHALRRSIGSRHRHVSNGNMNGTWTITSVDQSLIYRQQVRQVVKFSKATKEQLDLIVHVLRKASIRCARSGGTVTTPQLVQSTFGFF